MTGEPYRLPRDDHANLKEHCRKIWGLTKSPEAREEVLAMLSILEEVEK